MAAPPTEMCPPADPVTPDMEGDRHMVIFGIDAYKRSHTVVVIDGHGRQLAQRTTNHTATADHIELLRSG